MIEIDFNEFSESVLTSGKVETMYDFLTYTGHGLRASMSSQNINNLTKEESLSILQFKSACFYEEWDIDFFKDKESLIHLFNSYVTTTFKPITIEYFWKNYEKLIEAINYSTHNKNSYTNRFSDLYLGTKALKFPETEFDGSLQKEQITLNARTFIQLQDIVECYWNHEASLKISYFIVSKNKYYLIIEDIIC